MNYPFPPFYPASLNAKIIKIFVPLLTPFILSYSTESQAQTYTPTANTLYVKKGGSGNQSGSSWQHAVPELADALKWVYELNNVGEGAPIKIYVAKGLYFPKYSPEDGENLGTNQGRENSFYIGPNTQLYGGFDPDNNITDLEHPRTFGPGGSILSGDFNGDDVTSGEGATLEITGNGENAYHVVVITSTWQLDGGTFGKNTIVDGFTIRGGNANGASELPTFYVNKQAVSRNGGAGITVDGFHSLAMNDLIITSNAASGNGGGIRCGNLINEEGLRPVFQRLTITRNSANYGGGIHGTVAFPTLNYSTVSGNRATRDGGGIRNYWSPSIDYHVDTNPAFSQVTISNNHAGRDGGGIANSLSSPTLHTVTISNNVATRNGGGMYSYDRSHPRLNDVQITGNAAGDSGGGMYNDTSSPVMNDVLISLNNANGTQGDGGGIYNRSGSSPILDYTTIDRNTAKRHGGGIYSEGGATSSSPVLNYVTISANEAGQNAGGVFLTGQSEAKLTDVTITQNKAGNWGGGTYITSGQPEFANVTISLNTAAAGGGMYNASNASPRLQDVDIVENTAGSTLTTGSGGGVYNNSASPVFLNVTIRANSAGFGGGIMNNGGSGVFVNVLIAGNMAGANGGGVYNWSNSRPNLLSTTLAGNRSVGAGGAIYNNQNSGLTIRNSVVWNNSSGIANAAVAATPTITHSLVQERTGTDNGNLDATGIQEDGSSIFTDPFSHTEAPTLEGNYSLTPGTPVLNRGNKAYYEYSETDLVAQYLSTLGINTDLAANPRQYGPEMDMGAYELIHESALPVSLTAFNAAKTESYVLLSWKTTAEVNASHFEIQRSDDSRTFKIIGTHAAKGESSGNETYSFTDTNPFSERNTRLLYYRLRILDHDGTFAYSPIVSVQVGSSIPFQTFVYPNPAVNQVFLSQEVRNTIETLKMYDITGTEVPVTIDRLSHLLDVSLVPQGIYFLQIQRSGGILESVKLVINR